jgi:hypothetical protein
MPLVIPFTFVGGPGNKAKASEVNANFAAVAAKFSEGAGGILDGDISTSAAIKGTKISTTAGLRIPTAAIEDEAVTDAKLANDAASPGSDAGRAVSGDHIKTLTAAQVGRILPDLGKDNLKLTVHEVAFSFSVAGTGAPDGTAVALTQSVLPPSVAFATATYDLIGLYIKSPSVLGTLRQASRPHAGVSGANWTGAIDVLTGQQAADTFSGTLVYVFLNKTT